MSFSKLFIYPNCSIIHNLHQICVRNNSQFVIKLTSAVKIPVYRSSKCLSSRQYSTIFHSRDFYSTDHPFKPVSSSLNFASYLSTNGQGEKLTVVVTDPSHGNTIRSEIPANSSSFVHDKVNISGLESSTTDVPDVAVTLVDELQSVAEVVEPSLASLGLANWTPVGLVQMGLEYLHVGMHMPWWMAIAICTVVARILLLPLLIKTQRNAINMSNYMPQLQFLQAKFGEARRVGNAMEASRYASEIMIYMKEHNISPLKNAMLPMLQAPVFLSFFMGLRAMAKAPVESMKYGGLGWTVDLTIPDPYYVLPFVACGTLYIVLKIGADSGVKLENMKMAGYVLRALPVIAFPFCISFPSAVLYYWCTTNLCTLAIVSILKIQPIRQYLNLPTHQKLDEKFVLPKKGFVSGVKEAYEDQKVLALVEDRRRMDEIRFQKYGTGPIPRTYSYDPTKPRPANIAAAASRNISAKQKT